MTDAQPDRPPLLARRGAMIAIAALFFVLALGLYSGAAGNDFIWDDPIVFQRQMPYFDSLSNVFFPPPSIPQFGTHYYRPMTVLSYLGSEWAAETFWPLEERDEARRLTYHAAVVFWNALATMLVFLVGASVTRAAGRTGLAAPAVGAAAALLFATHPVHTEAVNWMAGCADVLCTVFMLASLLFYLRARRERDLLSVTLFALLAFGGMLTKETGVAIVFLVVLVELLLPRPDAPGAEAKPLTRAERRRAARGKAPARARATGWAVVPMSAVLLGAALFAYFSLRMSALSTVGTPANRTAESFVTAVFGSLGWYVKKTVWPPPLSAFVASVPGTLFVLLGLAVVAAVLAAIAWQFRAKSGWSGEIFAAGFFLATIAPALAIALLSISETRLAERYLFLPSVGACLLAALLLDRGVRAIGLSGVNRLLVPVAAAAVVAVPAAWATVERGEVWRTDLAFWTDAVEKAPSSGLPHLHLGIAYANMGRGGQDEESRTKLEDALEQYRLAYQKYDDAEGRSKALNNSGSIQMQLGQYAEAIRSFEGALAEVPNYPTAFYNWSLAEYNLAVQTADPVASNQRFNRSMELVRRALALNPRYTKAHLHYARSLKLIGRDAEARRHFQQVVQLAPASREANDARQALAQ